MGGTPHILIWSIRLNVQTRVGIPHKVLEQVEEPGGWVSWLVAEPMWRGGGSVVEPICRLVKCDFKSHSGSHQSSAWI